MFPLVPLVQAPEVGLGQFRLQRGDYRDPSKVAELIPIDTHSIGPFQDIS